MCRPAPGPRCKGANARNNAKKAATRNNLSFVPATDPGTIRDRTHSGVTTSVELAAYANHEDQNIRRNVAKHPNTDQDTLDRMVATGDVTAANQTVFWSVAGNENTRPETLARLAAADNQGTRLSAAANPRTPGVALSKLSRDKSAHVKARVAGNPNLPVEDIHRLTKAANREVQLQALQNSSLHAQQDVPATPATAPDAAPKVKAKSPRASTIAEQVKNYSATDQWAVLSDPGSDPEAVTALAWSRYPDVKNRLARSERITAKAAIHLLQSKDDLLREEVVQNHNCPPEALHVAAKHEDAEIRRLTAENMNTSTDTLLALLQDEDEDVRNEVAARDDLNQHSRVKAALAR